MVCSVHPRFSDRNRGRYEHLNRDIIIKYLPQVCAAVPPPLGDYLFFVLSTLPLPISNIEHMANTLLDDVRTQVTVDVDSMDPAVAAKHTGDVVRFCDMTSNQAIVFGEASRPERAVVLQAA